MDVFSSCSKRTSNDVFTSYYLRHSSEFFVCAMWLIIFSGLDKTRLGSVEFLGLSSRNKYIPQHFEVTCDYFP